MRGWVHSSLIPGIDQEEQDLFMPPPKRIQRKVTSISHLQTQTPPCVTPCVLERKG